MKQIFQYNDGGREAAGFKGTAGDCVVRAVAIAEGADYRETYNSVNAFISGSRKCKAIRRSSSRTGVMSTVTRKFLAARGWRWVPTMGIGTGTRVHLRADELPPGKLIVKLSGHLTVVIDGVIHDTYNPDRGGSRCVYGYWIR